MHFNMNGYKPLACLEPCCGDNVGAQKLRLSVLGATGSIGRQTLDVVAMHSDRFAVEALSTNRNVERAVELCAIFRPRLLAVSDVDMAARAQELVAARGLDVQVSAGPVSLIEAATLPEVKMVVTATVGYSGLFPTFAAISAGKDIALANKETLVVGGEYIRKLMANSTSRIFPVDSEHSAIAQCLAGEDMKAVSRLVLTASGGPFRTLPKDRLAEVRAADALKHPNWDMGAKITIDSATLMNKAFEIVEAHYLYGLPSERITAVVHPQSIVHSMVEFSDGAMKAQLGVPDMRIPIAYALGLNSRMAGVARPLTLADYANLTFERPDTERFPCLEFAGEALRRGGNAACVINAANEVAVSAFLNDKIKFTDIPNIIEKTLERVAFVAHPEPDDYVATDTESRAIAKSMIRN